MVWSAATAASMPEVTAASKAAAEAEAVASDASKIIAMAGEHPHAAE